MYSMEITFCFLDVPGAHFLANLQIPFSVIRRASTRQSWKRSEPNKEMTIFLLFFKKIVEGITMMMGMFLYPLEEVKEC